MTNVYPAISEDNTQMAVRYTYNNRQYFQIYNLIDGKFINPRGPVKRFSIDATYGDFQGFDLYGKFRLYNRRKSKKVFFESI